MYFWVCTFYLWIYTSYFRICTSHFRICTSYFRICTSYIGSTFLVWLIVEFVKKNKMAVKKTLRILKKSQLTSSRVLLKYHVCFIGKVFLLQFPAKTLPILTPMFLRYWGILLSLFFRSDRLCSSGSMQDFQDLHGNYGLIVIVLLHMWVHVQRLITHWIFNYFWNLFFSTMLTHPSSLSTSMYKMWCLGQ